MSVDQDEEHYLRYLPRNKKRGGWEGDEMELQHARDHKKKSIIRDDQANDSSSSSKHGNSVAVNIQDFYNNEVGKGYQAKHVIRQPHLNPHPHVNITDMSKPSAASSSSEVVVGNNSNRKENTPNTYTTLDALLKNQRLRAFRKELEKIYLEASNTKSKRNT